MANAAAMLGDTRNLVVPGEGSKRRSLNNNLNETWYGIYSPTPVTECRDRVFTDFTEATVESKKLNARFQKFTSENDARKFANTGHVDSPVRPARPKLQENIVKSPARKGTNSMRGSLGEDTMSTKSCPSVHQREIVKFRVAIEKGDLQTVIRCVNENPRYLISSIDKPVTVQTGSHYNALHCAAKSGQKEVAEYIMNHLLSDEPWNVLYPTENVNSTAHLERRAMVIDGYFNTSDKGCGETPLHFACKFGHLEFAQWLMSYNQVDVTQRNKYDQTAEEVAGTRCAGTEEIQRKVTQLVQDSRHSVYVPVVRAVDNSMPPFLGQPVTPEYLHSKRLSSNSSKILVGELSLDDSLIYADFETPNSDHSFRKNNSFSHNSPLSPSLSICAYAGPMLASGAKEFRKVWKTPPRELSTWRRDTLTGIMRSDSDRGLERVGRDLAVQQKVNWKEYWDFLDMFLNLREDDGLVELETYLLKNKPRFISGDAPSKTDQDVLHALPPGGIGQLTERYPNICTWYQQVLTFPEDERKCWTTPVAKRKLSKREILTSTPSRNRDNSDAGIVRNLMNDLSLEDAGDEERIPSPEQDIQEILVQGVSNLSVRESNKLFPKTYQQTPNLCGIEISESGNSGDQSSSQTGAPSNEPLPLPIPSSHWLLSSTPSEARQRYSKPSNSETTVNIDQPRNRVRRYLSFQVLRWLLIFIAVWTIYFAYVYFQADLFLANDSDRHL